MRGGTIVAAAGALMALPVAAQMTTGPARSISLLRDGAAWTPVAFVCDAIDRDRVLTLSAPGRGGAATLTSLSKPGLTRSRTQVRVGVADAGMNQRWYPLSDADGRDAGDVHAVNPAMVEPGATTPTVTSVTWRGNTSQCRFAPQTRLLGATAKRSVQVTGNGRIGYRYRSYDDDAGLPAIDVPWGGRDTRASTTIDGGRLIAGQGAQRVYQFEKGGYRYRVFASTDPARAGGGVQVWRAGRLLLSEPFGAYTAAL